MNRWHVRLAFLVVAFARFAFSPQARAACQEGCLTNDNTVLGDDALYSNIDGGDNTATGVGALYSNTEGWDNTASGLNALYSNTTGQSNTASGFAALEFNTDAYS